MSLCFSNRLEPSSAPPKMASGRYKQKKLTINWKIAWPIMFYGIGGERREMEIPTSTYIKIKKGKIYRKDDRAQGTGQ